ncbi:MAG: hypothetical protein NTY23_10280 [Chloroflexi bacterium]|nr:hypothetical protein [Chloroflexota bacterium]
MRPPRNKSIILDGMLRPAAVEVPVHLSPLELGTGRAEPATASNETIQWRLSLSASRRYADAQLDDYRELARRALPWSPPVRLCLSAHTSTPRPSGTFGFGFWNDPFSFGFGTRGAARRLPQTPQTAWFFYASPPSDMRLHHEVPGAGWKTATLRSRPLHPAVLLPGAAGAFLGMQLPPLRRGLFALMRRFYYAEETRLHFDPSQWHSYVIDWRLDRVVFLMDGEILAVSAEPPRAPLGLVIWMDNQFAVASPENGMRFGVVPISEPQWLEVANLHMTTGEPRPAKGT